MRLSTILFGILFFFLATCIIYLWGMKRQREEAKDLMNLLFSKGLERVRKYLKQHDQVTREEVEELCEDLSAGLPFSRKKAVVTDLEEFTDRLLGYMVKTGMLVKDKDEYKKVK